MKRFLLLTLLLSNVALADSIRTADGISCSFDSDDSPWEIETYAETGRDDYDSTNSDYSNNSNSNDSKVGVKLTYKFGGPRRLDCNSLYQLELRSKEAKVKELEAKVKALEAASNIKWAQ